MRNRSRLVFGSLAGAVVIHVVLVACSASAPTAPAPDASAVDASAAGRDAPAARDVADAVAAGDLGRALDVAVDVARDAASGMADAAVDALADLGRAEIPDAHAGGGPATEAACNVTTVQRVAQTGYVTLVTTYYAAVPTTVSARDVPDVRAVVCEPVEDTNPCRAYAATAGIECSVTGYAIGPSTCGQANAVLEAGRLLVPCGTVVTSTPATGTPTTSGFHYRRAFVRLP